MSYRTRMLAFVLALACLGLLATAPAAAARAIDAPAAPAEQLWEWPADGRPQPTVPFRAPAHEYAAGHRGMDIAVAPDSSVRAPADGVVAFRGTVVDRPLLTIEHSGGYVSTFEPLLSGLSAGDVVEAGDEIGTVASGGHALAGTLHLGVRLDGAYVNPMLLFGDVARAVLLPCCGQP